MEHKESRLVEAFGLARELYGELGVDVDAVLKAFRTRSISLQCWQDDDGIGFEANAGMLSSGGILSTGNHPGRARNGAELRADLEFALGLIPGRHRVNLHAIYAETGSRQVARNELGPEHFRNWIDWARERRLGIDFNPTFYAHPLASQGATLSHADPAVRRFWVEHGIMSRRIAAAIGDTLRDPSLCNLWIPDGSKDLPADRLGPRQRLRESLDEIFSAKKDISQMLDSIECKLFGIGLESYTVGSHEFYLNYSATRDGLLLCLDMGHFHPTESVSDKISAFLAFDRPLLLHVSRGVRWDSDHIVTQGDELTALFQEIHRCDGFGRIRIALDFFDASVDRATAWVIGARATLRTMLAAMLEPTQALQEAEVTGNPGRRLALMEEFRSLPANAVWDYHCLSEGVPCGTDWLDVAAERQAKLTRLRG